MQARTGAIVIGGMLASALAHAAPTPPSRAGFGPGVGGTALGGHRAERHEGGGYDDPYEGCGDSDVADLELRAWSLVPEVASRENVMTVFRLKNRGPCPARNVRVQSGGYDVFSNFVFTCPDLASDDGTGRCVFPIFAPGETKTFVLTATVCGFVTGETRENATYAILQADSHDPDDAGGPLPTYDIANAFVHVVGPYDDEGCAP